MGGVEPFLTAQRPTIKTPSMGEAGRLREGIENKGFADAFVTECASRKTLLFFPFF